MSRTRLKNRRANETRKIFYTSLANGQEKKLLITVGFDDDGIPREVFCADWKAGTDMHAVVMDACVLVSRLLQYGDDVSELAESMCKGPSLIGRILAVVAETRGPRAQRGDSDPVGDPVGSLPTTPHGTAEVAECPT